MLSFPPRSILLVYKLCVQQPKVIPLHICYVCNDEGHDEYDASGVTVINASKGMLYNICILEYKDLHLSEFLKIHIFLAFGSMETTFANWQYLWYNALCLHKANVGLICCLGNNMLVIAAQLRVMVQNSGRWPVITALKTTLLAELLMTCCKKNLQGLTHHLGDTALLVLTSDRFFSAVK